MGGGTGGGAGRRLFLMLAAAAGFMTPGISPVGLLRMLAVLFAVVFVLTLLWSVLTEPAPAQRASDVLRRRYPAGIDPSRDVVVGGP